MRKIINWLKKPLGCIHTYTSIKIYTNKGIFLKKQCIDCDDYFYPLDFWDNSKLIIEKPYCIEVDIGKDY